MIAGEQTTTSFMKGLLASGFRRTQLLWVEYKGLDRRNRTLQVHAHQRSAELDDSMIDSL